MLFIPYIATQRTSYPSLNRSEQRHHDSEERIFERAKMAKPHSVLLETVGSIRDGIYNAILAGMCASPPIFAADCELVARYAVAKRDPEALTTKVRDASMRVQSTNRADAAQKVQNCWSMQHGEGGAPIPSGDIPQHVPAVRQVCPISVGPSRFFQRLREGTGECADMEGDLGTPEQHGEGED